MVMSARNIINSGLLEFYVLGLTSKIEEEKVMTYLKQFPELDDRLLEIQNTLLLYAIEQGVVPKNNLETEIIKIIRCSVA